MVLFSCVDFFQNYFLSKSSYQNFKVWIRIRTDVLSVLFLVQAACNGYQQTTKIVTTCSKDIDKYETDIVHGLS